MGLKRRVFGYHDSSRTPGGATPAYQYHLLSTLGYFGSVINPDTGACKAPAGWPDAPIIAAAQAAGANVVLVAELGGAARNRAFLSSPSRRAQAVHDLVALVKAGHAQGLNLDLEEVPHDQRDNLTTFMKEVAQAVRAIPGAEVSAATPADSGAKGYDLKALAAACDYLVLMGYDYSYLGSTQAGPVAPLGGKGLNVAHSVTSYLAAGVAAQELVLGVPYYGIDWATDALTPHANVKRDAAGNVIKGHARGYADNVARATAAGYHFDATAQSPYTMYKDDAAQPHVAWFDDTTSLAAKYELVNANNLAGVAIWNLEWGGTEAPLWDALAAAFMEEGHIAARHGASSRARR